ncbi:folate receptor beta-like [Acanthaster planci]|uniref:Folate receptor beta-like n=1 Tax=Acanthaster planci TaxID=133434 RepID=A0A8B7XI74_ACAPL|nr:folate receptor beta-like [Acanthaster planci]XP_022079636.1 folate receptor beta-like [Acanthaster planci]XP_022079637.1 folate receptor beta-like [Acanthaster planci]XP_022079638.1 folate receptor beta-like [Acanthaster planci]
MVSALHLLTMAGSLHILLAVCLLCLVEAEKTTLEDYINTCMDGKNHKSKPGREASLFDQCAPWKNRSCCTPEVTEQMHVSPTWHNFDWNHCPTQLSPLCRKFLMQDLCFYECSPNVGPWLVPHNISIRNERFLGVPLCKTECDAWFDACKDDFTCKDNWSKGWDWSSGGNECPAGSTCRTFRETFKTAEYMCENIWGGSFEVVADNEPCMLLFFNGPINPNDKIARMKAEELLNAGATASLHAWMLLSLTFASIGLMSR